MTGQVGSQAAYARHRDVSKQTVTDWKSMGLVVFNDNGRVDFDATDAALKSHGIRQQVDASVDDPDLVDDATAALSADNEGLWSKAEAERRKENFAARLKELQFAKESGLVVDIDDVVVAVAHEYAIVRNKLLDVGTKVAPRVRGLQSAEEIKAIIDARINEALKELALDVDGERDYGKLRQSIQKRFSEASDGPEEGEE